MFSIIMGRLERDRPTIKPVDRFTFKEIFRSASSPHVIIVFIMSFMVGTTLFGLALFLPSIVSQLGFSPNKTQLLSVGPFAAGFFGERFLVDLKCDILDLVLTPHSFLLVTLFSAFCSDRYKSRGITIALVSLLAVIGFALYLGKIVPPCVKQLNLTAKVSKLGAEHKFTSYGALYLMVSGVYGTTPVLSAWMANNSEPYFRRATSVAIGFIAINAVCFACVIIVIIIYLVFVLFFSTSGRHFEYLAFPNQRRTKIQENNNYESRFVSVHLGFSSPPSPHSFNVD